MKVGDTVILLETEEWPEELATVLEIQRDVITVRVFEKYCDHWDDGLREVFPSDVKLLRPRAVPSKKRFPKLVFSNRRL